MDSVHINLAIARDEKSPRSSGGFHFARDAKLKDYLTSAREVAKSCSTLARSR